MTVSRPWARPRICRSTPTTATTKEVFAHYVPWFPLSIDNLPASQDYYTTQFLNPYGEGGSHAANGGYLRDRPLPQDPINDPNWKTINAKTEVNQAKSIGIDGFAVDIVDPGGYHDATITALYTAASSTTGFTILPTADMSGRLGGMTAADFAKAIAPYLTSPGGYKLSDGRVVLGAFYAELQNASWWGSALTYLNAAYGLNVAFVPTFLNASAYMASFAPISYGVQQLGRAQPGRH